MTEKIKIVLEGYKCEKCGHVWIPRKGEKPIWCPKCHSVKWYEERNIKKKEKY
jgi:predicted Zn-ribbon and HTH transcriptional regulator